MYQKKTDDHPPYFFILKTKAGRFADHATTTGACNVVVVH